MTLSKTLILGLGNPTRGDDAAGWVLAERIQKLHRPGVEVRTAQQLTPEWAAAWASYERVAILDAALAGPDVRLARVEPSEAPDQVSHGLTPETLTALTRRLYAPGPLVWLCAMRGETFEFGLSLSAAMECRVNEAQQLLQRWL